MSDKNYKAVERLDSFDKVDIYCFDQEKVYNLKNGVYVGRDRPKRGVTMVSDHKPLITVENPGEFVQALLSVGVKLPAQGFTEGQLEAMTDHLADMKEILFHNMGIKG